MHPFHTYCQNILCTHLIVIPTNACAISIRPRCYYNWLLNENVLKKQISKFKKKFLIVPCMTCAISTPVLEGEAKTHENQKQLLHLLFDIHCNILICWKNNNRHHRQIWDMPRGAKGSMPKPKHQEQLPSVILTTIGNHYYIDVLSVVTSNTLRLSSTLSSQPSHLH